jgi:hypothetical protein
VADSTLTSIIPSNAFKCWAFNTEIMGGGWIVLQSEEKESYPFPKRNTPAAASLNKRNALLRLFGGQQQGIIWKSGVYTIP